MGFSRQESWSGVPFPSSGDLPDSGIEPGPPALQKDSLLSGSPAKPQFLQTGEKEDPRLAAGRDLQCRLKGVIF